VKSIDQDLWHIISIGDFKPTKTSFENQNDYLKFDKNDKTKIMIYKAFPRIEYERVYFC
jgi:catalase